MKKKKIFIWTGVTVGGILALCIVILLVAQTVAKSYAESGATAALGAEVSVGHFALAPFSGRATLSGVEVGNPEGYDQDPMVQISRIAVKMDTGSLFSDKMQIEVVEVEGTELALEFSGRTSNVGALMKNLKKGDTSGETRVNMQKLVISETKVRVAGAPATQISVPRMEMDFQEKGAMPVSDTLRSLIAILQRAIRTVGANVLPSERVEQLGSELETVLSGGGELLQGIGVTGAGAVKDVFQSVTDILPGQDEEE